jgi:RNA polymerase sigma-70 factor (ECF subfamily)
MLRAYAAWPEMKCPEQPTLAAWLRRILARTLADVVKHYDRDKRAVDLERSLEADLERSASGLAGRLAADQTSPSQAAIRNEEMLRLADALAALPEQGSAGPPSRRWGGRRRSGRGSSPGLGRPRSSGSSCRRSDASPGARRRLGDGDDVRMNQAWSRRSVESGWLVVSPA